VVVTTVAVVQYFRTPKGLLTIVLLILVALAAPKEGIDRLAPGFLSAVGAAALIDATILRFMRHRQTRDKWEFPGGAVLTAMFVAMVLSAREPWHVTAVTSVLAVVSKYVLRTRAGNIFNPAALAIVAAFYVFNAAQSWWGALPNLPPAALIVLMATGIFIADRVNRMPLVVAFLGSYFLLFTSASFVGEPRLVAEIFRAPDLHAVLFFAFFILTDPPTSPVKYRGQLVCGVVVAVASFAVFESLGAVHFLLTGVLVGNIYEAWQRGRPLTLRHFALPAAATR
jgi:Na+-translocating ferredoxin:NAD+ oxidoreductase RnfD subunit